MIYRILSVLLAINSILIIVDIYQGYEWEDTFRTLTFFCFLYVIMLVVFEINERTKLLVQLNDISKLLDKTMQGNVSQAIDEYLEEDLGTKSKDIVTEYGYNKNLEWGEIKRSESNPED